MNYGTTEGSSTYAGTYRIICENDGESIKRYLQIRRTKGWVKINREIPAHIIGAYSAANYLKV